MTSRFNAAVVGLGEMGLVHLKAAIDSPFIANVIGFDPSPSRVDFVRQKFKIPMAHSFEAILYDKDVRMVYIASPNQFHCDQTIKCLESGKAVLCEKPMGSSQEEARQIVQVQKK